MDPLFILLVIIIALALTFDYINGFHDAANAIATVVATRVLSPKTAVLFGAVLNFAGAMAGTEVAATVAKGLVNPAVISLETILCALIGAIIWNLITWWKGLPSSSSHALIGSLMGAACFWVGGVDGSVIYWDKILQKVVIPMFSSPLIGFFLGYLVMATLTKIVYKYSLNRINRVFKPLQIVSAGFMAFHHGSNDAQKSMGIIALAIMLYSHHPVVIDLLIILPCAIAIALGTMSGGWKIIRTIGSKMIRLQPIHGFAAETTASLCIAYASHSGIPLSTTHIITSSIMGVGATKRLSAVKWSLVGSILWAWVLTIPVTFFLSGGIAWLYKWAQASLRYQFNH
ncbi:MAG: inorganic phosphate transporter [Candidatus Melainabacteria bacterium]|nr:inorganic phosphate transporter [Candidatus Melainabacteria bacterium]